MFKFFKKKKQKQPFGLIKPFEYEKTKNSFQMYFDFPIQECIKKSNLNMICIADTHGNL